MGRGRRAVHARPPAPTRRCLACRKARPQAELLRLALQGGQVVVDVKKILPGRGCSLCRDEKCAREAVKGRKFGRALRGKAQEPAIDRVLQWLLQGPVA